jgi:hypothetical protein
VVPMMSGRSPSFRRNVSISCRAVVFGIHNRKTEVTHGSDTGVPHIDVTAEVGFLVVLHKDVIVENRDPSGHDHFAVRTQKRLALRRVDKLVN